jgi:hypothetical protein
MSKTNNVEWKTLLLRIDSTFSSTKQRQKRILIKTDIRRNRQIDVFLKNSHLTKTEKIEFFSKLTFLYYPFGFASLDW